MKWIWPFRGSTPRPAKRKPCPANSGLFMGYRCELDRDHEGKHEATISRTTDGSGREIGRKTVSW